MKLEQHFTPEHLRSINKLRKQCTANDCGNQHIDNLAVVGRMQDVWHRLEAMFPMVQAHSEAIWHARRDGRVRHKIENDQRFSSLNEPPTQKSGWELLAYAALEAAGFSPCGSAELYNYEGMWLEISEDHPWLKKRHHNCEWCASGAKPCPITNYPDAHVSVPARMVRPTLNPGKYQ